jgi:hypothetical protein
MRPICRGSPVRFRRNPIGDGAGSFRHKPGPPLRPLSVPQSEVETAVAAGPRTGVRPLGNTSFHQAGPGVRPPGKWRQSWMSLPSNGSGRRWTPLRAASRRSARTCAQQSPAADRCCGRGGEHGLHRRDYSPFWHFDKSISLGGPTGWSGDVLQAVSDPSLGGPTRGTLLGASTGSWAGTPLPGTAAVPHMRVYWSST